MAAITPSAGAAPGPSADRLDASWVRIEAGPGGGRTIFRSGAYLTGPSAASPDAIVLDYARAHAAELGLSAHDARGLYVDRVQVTPRDGVGRVVLGQAIDGIRVHTALLVGTVAPDGRLVMLSGRTAPARTSGRAALTAGDAIAAASLIVPDPLAEDPVVEGSSIELIEVTNVQASGQREWEVVAVAPGRSVIRGGARSPWAITVEVASP